MMVGGGEGWCLERAWRRARGRVVDPAASGRAQGSRRRRGLLVPSLGVHGTPQVPQRLYPRTEAPFKIYNLFLLTDCYWMFMGSRTMGKQASFEFKTWGGKRRGAGRPPKGPRSSEPHRRRERFS